MIKFVKAMLKRQNALFLEFIHFDNMRFLITLVIQVGIGHNFQLKATGWKWKLSTCLGGDGVSQIRNKSKLNLFPGFDLRLGWKAEYVLPEIHGYVWVNTKIFLRDIVASRIALCIKSLLTGRFQLVDTTIQLVFIFALCRAVGTGEPAFSMNYGRLQASIDRVEAIVTQSDRCWTS